MGVAKCDTLYQDRTVNELFTLQMFKKGMKKLKVKELNKIKGEGLKVKELNNMSKEITLSEVNKLESRKLRYEK